MIHLDLRKDLDEVLAFTLERVRSFDPKTNDGPGTDRRVTRIDVGYQCDQAGWVCLVFDTRSKAEPGGSWNAHIEANEQERPEWLAASEADVHEPIVVILPSGKEK